MSRISFAYTVLVLAIALSGSPGHAQPIRLGSSGHGKQVSLTVNYQSVATLRQRNAASASERANTALSRLSGLAKAGRAVHFAAGRGPGGWGVLANGGVVVIASAQDAKAAGVKRRTLAHRWASAFSRAWALPLVRLSASSVVIPAGASRSIRVSGVGRGAIRVSVDAAASVSARTTPGAISLLGISPGRGTVTVSRDGATVTSAFRVMKWAGSVETVTLEVTGNAVPRELIQELVHSEAYRGIRLEPGAWSVMGTGSALPAVWTRGQSYRASVGVRIGGSGYLPVETRIPLLVVRRKLPADKRLDLFYSNHPETLDGPKVLFRHAVSGGTPTRLLYHHQNTSERPLVLAVDLRNEGDGPARVQVIDGTTEAAVDTVLVGHQAAFKFLKRTKAGAGIIVELRPHSVRRLTAISMRTGETASGIIMVRPLGNGSLSLSTVAEPTDGGTPNGQTKGDANPVFSSPDQAVAAAYTVGGPWTYVPIGNRPVSNAAGMRLDGNYGVIYTVHLRLENPTAARRTVRVLFEPRAGEARAALIINGTLTETGRAVPPAELTLTSVSLAPHEVRTITIVTMPAAGSSYPAALIAHS